MKVKMMTLLYSFLIIISCTQEEIKIVRSYSVGMSMAKNENKEVLLIFEWWGNPTTTTFEYLENSEVKTNLKNKIIILLMVDEDGESGIINSRIQKESYGSFVQPQYYRLKSDSTIISGPLEYCDINTFIEFLKYQSSDE